MAFEYNRLFTPQGNNKSSIDTDDSNNRVSQLYGGLSASIYHSTDTIAVMDDPGYFDAIRWSMFPGNLMFLVQYASIGTDGYTAGGERGGTNPIGDGGTDAFDTFGAVSGFSMKFVNIGTNNAISLTTGASFNITQTTVALPANSGATQHPVFNPHNFHAYVPVGNRPRICMYSVTNDVAGLGDANVRTTLFAVNANRNSASAATAPYIVRPGYFNDVVDYLVPGSVIMIQAMPDLVDGARTTANNQVTYTYTNNFLFATVVLQTHNANGAVDVRCAGLVTIVDYA